MSQSGSNQTCDYFLHKAVNRLNLLEDLSDHDEELPISVDSFLRSVVETYEVIGELTSADKQQVSAKLSAIKEMGANCNHEMKGGAFDGVKWKCTAKAVFEGLTQTVNEACCTQILQQLQMCEHNLNDVKESELTQIVLTNFQRLLGNTARLLELLYEYIRLGTLKGKRLQDALLLCSLQLQKCFSLLLQVLENGNHTAGQCHEAKEYLVQRTKVCFHKVQLLIKQGRAENVEDDLGGGLFILHMDHALSLLAVFDASPIHKPTCDNWRDSIQNVLQHALLIAQVASPFDFKMIHGSGEKILRECENLSKECKAANVNPAMCKLYANTLSDALEELEQRVCAAVLRMYLQVFSDLFSPLQELCSRCWVDAQPGEERSADYLNGLVAALDAHTDCITQVALFAIACSNDEKRVLGIRSCLASLESLEPQLVPALTSLYLRQGTPKWEFVCMLVHHWNTEVKHLWNFIDGIIDSAALAQVTRDAIWVPASTLKKALEKHQILPQKEISALVHAIVTKASVFASQLQLTFDELSLPMHSPIHNELNNLVRAVREGEAVLLHLQQEASSLSGNRILKRCELLVSCVQRIQPLLEEFVDPGAATSSPDGRVQVLNTNTTPDKHTKKMKQYSCLGLNFPSDVDIELDVTDTFLGKSTVQHFSQNPPSTVSKIATSFLYKDQSALRVPTTTASFRGSPRSYIFSRKKYQIESSQNLLQETFCLDVTNILENMTNPSQTFHAWKDAIPSPYPQVEDIRGRKSLRVNTFEGRIQPSSHSSSCSSFVSGNIKTPERLQDLLQVQERIDAVKISSLKSGDCHPKM